LKTVPPNEQKLTKLLATLEIISVKADNTINL